MPKNCVIHTLCIISIVAENRLFSVLVIMRYGSLGITLNVMPQILVIKRYISLLL